MTRIIKRLVIVAAVAFAALGASVAAAEASAAPAVNANTQLQPLTDHEWV